MPLTTRKQALAYHAQGRPGKIEVVATKPCLTQIDLSLAYSPGVAEPCREIARDPEKVFDYTARGNLVAVVSDGSAVLGLGSIGPLAAKPVMEGKAVLFKRFADIDVFDLELGTQEVDEIVATVKNLEPTISGVNLEDIAAPRCFEIERRLTEEMGIPVFHDDQHGTALIAGAALLNALEIAGKDIGEVRMVVNGAGAAALACARFAIHLGVDPEKILILDSKGVLTPGREDLNPYKREFARETDRRSLAEALAGADVFFGVSVGNVVTPEMLRSMARDPIVLAMANPDPEISWEAAHEARPDVIMGTGRSDYPNQVNNVLGFPYVFRGALDVRACCINEAMTTAAARALAELAREPVPGEVLRAYGLKELAFGRGYLIPKPLDPRILSRVATAVARAAIQSGVARREVDLGAYARELTERMGPERDLMRRVVAQARLDPKRIVFPEGEHEVVLQAAESAVREGIARPLLIGRPEEVQRMAESVGVSLNGMEVVDPAAWPRFDDYARELSRIRQHRNPPMELVRERLLDPTWFGPMMVRMGDADGMVAGATRAVRKTLEPILKVIPLQDGVRRAAAVSLLITKQGALFLADTALNIEPIAEDLADIAILTADFVRRLDIEPRVAMLSFSSYGGTPHPRSDMVRRAVEIAREEAPDLLIDGEMRVDAALDPRVQARYPKSRLGGKRANVLIFPSLESANIGFNLVRLLADTSVIGPLHLGLAHPVHMAQPHSCDASDLLHLTAFAVTEAQALEAAAQGPAAEAARRA